MYVGHGIGHKPSKTWIRSLDTSKCKNSEGEIS